MRVQMKLAGETIAAMDMASFYTLGRDWGVSRGDLIEYVVDKYGGTYKDVDWLTVGTPSRLPEAQSVQTAFDLSERIVKKLDEIQKYFSEVFSAKRNVYKPFVIKMLFFKLLNDFEDEHANFKTVIDHNVVGLMTCNFHDENNPIDKENRLKNFYQSMTGEEIIGFQEYAVGPKGKWLDWWKDEYEVFAPKDILKHPRIHFASVVLVDKRAFKSFEQLKLKTDVYWNRYVYGILTYTPNRKLRYLNIHIPQGVRYPNESKTDHEARLKEIEELWKAVIKEVRDNIDCQEEWVITGDLNAYDGSRFDKYWKELRNLLVDVDVDFHGKYIKETWRDKKLDYILVDRRTALKFWCEASIDDRPVLGNVTDHKVLTARIVEKRTISKGGEEIQVF